MAQNWNIRVSTAVYCELDEYGWYGVQCEGLSESGTGLSDQLQAPYGFAARPLDASVDADGNVEQGCEVFRASLGRTHSLSWLGHDTRYSDKCPPLTKGSCAQWNAKGAFALFDSEENTYTIYLPIAFDADGVPTKAHLVQVGDDGTGEQSIKIVHACGYNVEITETDGIKMDANDGATRFTMKPGEVVIQATKVMIKGNVYVGAQAEAGLPLLPSTASPPCPSLFLSPV